MMLIYLIVILTLTVQRTSGYRLRDVGPEADDGSAAVQPVPEFLIDPVFGKDQVDSLDNAKNYPGDGLFPQARRDPASGLLASLGDLLTSLRDQPEDGKVPVEEFFTKEHYNPLQGRIFRDSGFDLGDFHAHVDIDGHVKPKLYQTININVYQQPACCEYTPKPACAPTAPPTQGPTTTTTEEPTTTTKEPTTTTEEPPTPTTEEPTTTTEEPTTTTEEPTTTTEEPTTTTEEPTTTTEEPTTTTEETTTTTEEPTTTTEEPTTTTEEPTTTTEEPTTTTEEPTTTTEEPTTTTEEPTTTTEEPTTTTEEPTTTTEETTTTTETTPSHTTTEEPTTTTEEPTTTTEEPTTTTEEPTTTTEEPTTTTEEPTTTTEEPTTTTTATTTTTTKRTTPTRPPYPPSTPEPCKENTKADIVLLLDASTSIGWKNWKYQTQMAANITKYFDVGVDKVRFATTIFNGIPTKEFDLKDHLDHESLSKALLAIAYPGIPGTKTNLALQDITNKNMFGAEAGGRDDAPDILIVMTDGKSDNTNKTMAEAAKLKLTGMTIIAVGIGPDPSQEELKEIASSPENVFNAASYDLLAYIMQSLVRKTCDTAKSAAAPA